MNDVLEHCSLCPRQCGTDRKISRGYCGADIDLEISKIMLHHWEEPCISGNDCSRGSGAVFFTHCPLGCVFCQNNKISRRDSLGKKYSVSALADEMLRLQDNGAYNINLVSPTQYTVQIAEAIGKAKKNGLSIPVVWNTGGYELPTVIESLCGIVDIFLTDFKYADSAVADKYSCAPDYPEYAEKALSAMYSVTGKCVFNEDMMLRRGVIVRHLVLPSHRNDSINVLRKVASLVPPDKVLLSLMAQYTCDFLPPSNGVLDEFSKIRRKITTYEYDAVISEASSLGFDGFTQERTSAQKKFTPDF